MNFLKEDFFRILTFLEKKAEENIELCSDKFSYMRQSCINQNEEYKRNIIDNCLHINYINNCLKQKRFMTIEERISFINNQTFPHKLDSYLLFSQGLKETVTWKGNTMYKSAHDLIIYQMLLWELKPKTIIEIGSGNGSSADYFSSLNSIYNNECEIFSFDINNENIKKNQINFLKTDLMNIDLLNNYLHIFNNLKRPVLVVEDAHVNLQSVIPFFSKILISGDYFIIEDSKNLYDKIYDKSTLINTICKNEGFLVDTKFTDFFGVNITTAFNSILKKI